MEITVRRLEEEDAPAFWDLRLEALETEPFAFGELPEEHRLVTTGQIVALICTGDAFAVGAFVEDRLVGIVRFVRPSRQKERHKGHIRSVYVTASQRGRRVARAMIEKLIAEASHDPTLEHLLLSVGTYNQSARSVYQSLGFVFCGTEPRAMKIGSEYVDEEQMILRLR